MRCGDHRPNLEGLRAAAGTGLPWEDLRLALKRPNLGESARCNVAPSHHRGSVGELRLGLSQLGKLSELGYHRPGRSHAACMWRRPVECRGAAPGPSQLGRLDVPRRPPSQLGKVRNWHWSTVERSAIGTEASQLGKACGLHVAPPRGMSASRPWTVPTWETRCAAATTVPNWEGPQLALVYRGRSAIGTEASQLGKPVACMWRRLRNVGEPRLGPSQLGKLDAPRRPPSQLGKVFEPQLAPAYRGKICVGTEAPTWESLRPACVDVL